MQVVEPEKVFALRKWFGESFLAKSREAGTEIRENLGRRARWMQGVAVADIRPLLPAPKQQFQLLLELLFYCFDTKHTDILFSWNKYIKML